MSTRHSLIESIPEAHDRSLGPTEVGMGLVARHRDAVVSRLLADEDLRRTPSDRAATRRAIARALAADGVVLGPADWARLVRDLTDELVGLGPLESLLRDPATTDVLVDGPRSVWVERSGEVVRTDVRFRDDDHLLDVVRRVVEGVGARLDMARPWADASLPGGVRVHAILPPLADRPLVTLRRVPAVIPTWDDFAASGSIEPEAVDLLRELVDDRANVVVAGRAGAGKTTLLSRMLASVGDQRIVVIEDTPELRLPDRAVGLRTRAATVDGVGAVDTAALVRNALRMRPDRVVVGEVRGAEVADVLQAMNTGHPGSMCTVHANGAADALVRLEGMALLAGVPSAAARAQIASAVDVVVHLDRSRDGRRVLAEIADVTADRDRGWQVRNRWPSVAGEATS